MEVRETAACGIAQRVFAIECEEDDFIEMYRLLRFVRDGVGFFDENFLDELLAQLGYIIGPEFEDDPPDDSVESEIEWKDEGTTYYLNFNDETSRRFRLMLQATEHPKEGFDTELLNRLMDEMLKMNPVALCDLPVINR